VIKKINPRVEIIDITHQIPSYNISYAAFSLEKSFIFFPESTIFLVVVDPGVGSTRKILLVNHDNYYFIAPDNGVLTPILLYKDKTVREINNDGYFLIKNKNSVGMVSTFEARDKMAPIAAYLSLGVDPNMFTSKISKFVLNKDFLPVHLANSIEGRVIYIDKFGNLVTNVSREFLLKTMNDSGYKIFQIKIKKVKISDTFNTYSEGEKKPFMVMGSHGNLEIALNKKSAAEFLNVNVNEKVFFEFA
jgi:S-adenosylmethionine hydrolase